MIARGIESCQVTVWMLGVRVSWGCIGRLFVTCRVTECDDRSRKCSWREDLVRAETPTVRGSIPGRGQQFFLFSSCPHSLMLSNNQGFLLFSEIKTAMIWSWLHLVLLWRMCGTIRPFLQFSLMAWNVRLRLNECQFGWILEFIADSTGTSGLWNTYW